MAQSVIQLKNISKQYKLKHLPGQIFRALQNVCLEVPPGQTLAIVGKNGSGKSTLLQILAGITAPTQGICRIRGKIATLLDLGAGFHPDFTGRENTRLQGLLAGLPPKEAETRLPEVERFADIGSFFDEPVRTYSSGMFVRLAFAAAIHADPDILLIDEVLAVGDARFQQKCFQKIKDFQQLGKTIVFVTHDLQTAVRHSHEAVLMHRGAILEKGDPFRVTNVYHELLMSNADARVPSAAAVLPLTPEFPDTLESFLADTGTENRYAERPAYNPNERRYGSRRAEILDFFIVCGGRPFPSVFGSGQYADVYLKVRFNATMREPVLGFYIKTVDGVMVYGINSYLDRTRLGAGHESEIVFYKFRVKLDLHSGDYMIHVGIGEQADGRDELADSRANFIHLCIEQKNGFDGLVLLDSRFEEAGRFAQRGLHAPAA